MQLKDIFTALDLIIHKYGRFMQTPSKRVKVNLLCYQSTKEIKMILNCQIHREIAKSGGISQYSA